METKPPIPPFTLETATQKVRAAEDAWNTRNPDRVALAYTEDSQWRNRSEFLRGRDQIREFLKRKWAKELDYRLIKELWAFTDDRIAVRFAYEWHDDSGHWYRAYGNENWEFNPFQWVFDTSPQFIRGRNNNEAAISGHQLKPESAGLKTAIYR